VAVALAADSWRQGLQESETERTYLARLGSELGYGRSNLESSRDFYESAQSATDQLIDALESAEGNPANEDDLAALFVRAASIGGTGAIFIHDTVYAELVSTGRLNIIKNTELRGEIAGYYTALANAVGIWENVPQASLERFMVLTGYAPIDLANDGQLTKEEIRRVVTALFDDEDVIGELRYQVARLGRLLDSENRLIERNVRLTDAIAKEVG
jgi:hypothetical protein